MVETEFTIINKLGIHARPASQIVKTASQFASVVTLKANGSETDAKSIMGIMMLAAAHGATIKISATGPDEQAALDAIVKLFMDKFNED